MTRIRNKEYSYTVLKKTKSITYNGLVVFIHIDIAGISFKYRKNQLP